MTDYAAKLRDGMLELDLYLGCGFGRGGLVFPVLDCPQRGLGQQGMAANIFQPADGAVGADPNLHLDRPMKVHLSRDRRIFGVLAVNNFPVRLIGAEQSSSEKRRAGQKFDNFLHLSCHNQKVSLRAN